MLDFDLASLYQIPTKVLNHTVKRNIKRFPEDYVFRLSILEWQGIQSQFVTAAVNVYITDVYKVIETLSKRNTSITPYAFTEQGVAMLSGILNSDIAINTNVIIR